MTPQERKDFAALIKPAVKGQSDKFSWRLYQRVEKLGRERVYIMAWDDMYGEPFTPDLAALKRGDKVQRNRLMIGTMRDGGWFSGLKLFGVTIRGRAAYASSMAYSPQFNTSAWLDVTDWFWDAYLRQGRCIIHGDQVHSWLTINKNARKCAHCGKHERRSIETIKKIERREVWV